MNEETYLGVEKRTLEMALKNYIMKITFVKKDGSVREMYCTRNIQFHPEYEKKTDKVRNLPEHLISVVDVDLNEWRMINVNTVKGALFCAPASEFKK
jgi:hypothetical protein